MRTRLGLLTALGALLATAALGASGAAADTTLTGETAEGVAVKLTVGEFGNATAFRIGATKAKCQHGTLKRKSVTHRNFTSDPGEFGDRLRAKGHDGALTLKSRIVFAGRAVTEDLTRWEGKYNLTTKVFDHRELIDTCRLRTTWDAS
jgi:hypothetical protein